MVVRKDIVELSIPFSAGIAAAAALDAAPDVIYMTACCCACLSAAMILSCTVKSGFSKVMLRLMFLPLGFLCGLTSRICGTGSIPPPPVALQGLESLTGLIDRTDFHSEHTAPLLKALLTGQRDSLGQDTIKAFRDSGASHILALSGLHLGIIYACISSVLRILGKSRSAFIARSLLSIAMCSFYVMMTGAGPSIVRAFLFIVLNELSRLSPSRHKDPVAVLCAALMVQLCLSPTAISSVGFQLSYLAMLGIFLLFPVLRDWYPEGRKWDPVRKIWNSMALSLSCQIMTAPVAWIHFHTFPEHFLLTNLIALPLTEALMVCSVAALVLSGAGICPEFIKAPVDYLAGALIFCLDVIAGM